jgi:hypothetical protein
MHGATPKATDLEPVAGIPRRTRMLVHVGEVGKRSLGLEAGWAGWRRLAGLLVAEFEAGQADFVIAQDGLLIGKASAHEKPVATHGQ